MARFVGATLVPRFYSYTERTTRRILDLSTEILLITLNHIFPVIQLS